MEGRTRAWTTSGSANSQAWARARPRPHVLWSGRGLCGVDRGCRPLEDLGGVEIVLRYGSERSSFLLGGRSSTGLLEQSS